MDSQCEVRNLFAKLSSWQEESQREFSIILDSHSRSINKGINELLEQLSAITKERDDLLGKVEDLQGEVWRQNSKLHVIQSLTESEGNPNQEGSRKLEFLDAEVQGVETGDEMHLLDKEDNLDNSILNEIEDENVKSIECIVDEEQVHFEQSKACSDSQEKAQNSENGKIEDGDITKHGGKCKGYAIPKKSHLNEHKDAEHKTGGKRFECKWCPYTSVHPGHFKRHTKTHQKRQNHVNRVCGECGYATLCKYNLNQHIKAVH